METIRLQHNGVAVDVELTRKRMRTIRVRVLSGGRVVASAPIRMTKERVEAFLLSRREWIIKNHLKQQSRNGFIEMPFAQAGQAYYLGVKRKFVAAAAAKDDVEVAPDAVYVFYKGAPERALRVYEAFLRREAAARFTRLVDKWMPVFSSVGVKRPSLKVRAYKAKWGTCFPTRGEIVMNLHLIKAEESLSDYVVLHEMTHLIYRGHGKDFYAFMLRLMPDAKQRRARLNAGVTE